MVNLDELEKAQVEGGDAEIAAPRKRAWSDEAKQKAAEKRAQTLAAKSPAATGINAQPGDVSLAEGRKRLKKGYTAFWDALAAVWEDEELKVTSDEADEWAEPMADTFELMGWLHHTRKAQPITALVVTVKQTLPRAQRIAQGRRRQLFQAKAQTGAEFRVPPGMKMPQESTIVPAEPIFTEGLNGPAPSINHINEPTNPIT